MLATFYDRNRHRTQTYRSCYVTVTVTEIDFVTLIKVWS